MRYQYNLYIMKHLAMPTLLITASLTSIIWLIQALRFIDFIVNRGLSIGDFIYITSLLFPSLLMLLVPIALFIAVLFTYNKLTTDSELVVLKAAGLSRWQLAIPAIWVGVVATAFCYFLSLYLLPVSNRQFNDMRTFLRDNYTSVLLQEEVFNHPVTGLTVFVRKRDSEGNLEGILVHDARFSENPVTMMAEEGQLVQTPAGPRFYLVKGLRQEMRNGRLSWLNFDSYTLDISFYTGTLNERERDPDEKFLGELFDQNADTKQSPQLKAEGHQRIAWPLYNVALSMLAVAMLLSGEYNRRGQWKRIILTGAMGAGAVLLAISLRNMIVKQPELTPSIYVLLAIVMLSSAVVLSTHRSGRSSKPMPEPV